MLDRQSQLIEAKSIAWLTAEQMVEVDRIMIEDLGIQLIQMMENAGRNLAQLALDLYAPTTVAVYAGRGGNGGGGLVAARHLANRGVDVHVVTARSSTEFAGIPRHQLDVIERMEVARPLEPPPHVDLSVDALIGYSLRAAPSGRALQLIDALNACSAPVLSLDIPSGLDSTTGAAPGEVVGADATLTLALPKSGLRDHKAVGRLFVGDISVPPVVYEQLGIGAQHPFSTASIIEVSKT